MRERILELLTSHGILIEPQAMEYLLAKEEPLEHIKKVLTSLQEYPLIINLEILKNLEGVEEPKRSYAEVKNFIKEGFAEPELRILQEIKKSSSSGTLENFAKYFGSRYEQLKKMMKVRRELFGASNIAELKSSNATLKLIAMVKDVRVSKEAHKLLELEDTTGATTALIPNNSKLIKEAIMRDEVIGIVGRRSQRSNLVIVEDIIRPEFQVRPIAFAQRNFYAAFISDLHLGSKTFLHNAWEKFIAWLRSENELARKLRYLVISGDCVDGVGVYPKQEKDLELKDIFKQYQELARKISQLPNYIKIIILPGNHDAVRQAEPQPPLHKELTKYFPENVIFTSNPCYFSMNGIEVLAYHGKSMDDFVTTIPNASYTTPIMIMKEMLKRRHLAVVYGARTPLAPEEHDWLVINKIPHIFVTGHVHRAQVELYKNIVLINSSTWQSQTSYQAMQGFLPQPAKVAFVNLHTLEYTIVDFS
ncbi:MAG: DNA-directed DNA polymerase II small subunit [Candidatus Thermoplasmatota archaeon]|nr:DNA-directed DNA polymerase II small subunit [Candidatus Thermoplasmatota archaeon]